MSLVEPIPGFEAWTRRRFRTGECDRRCERWTRNVVRAEDAHSTATMIDVPFEKRNPRTAIIDTGGRGTSLLENLLAADGQVVTLCDLVKARAEHAGSLVVAAGQKQPQLYIEGDHAFEQLLAREDVDLVLVATPWAWHAEMAVSAMKHGKHVAIEVPGVQTIEDCWKIVKTSEETRKHCVILENCC